MFNGHKVHLGRLGIIGLTCDGTGSDCEEGVTVKKNVKSLRLTLRPSEELKTKMQGVKKELVPPPDKPGNRYDEHGALLIIDKT